MTKTNYLFSFIISLSFIAFSNIVKAEANGCGPEGFLGYLVANGPFKRACDIHDKCYESETIDQAKCDSQFKKTCMQFVNKNIQESYSENVGLMLI